MGNIKIRNLTAATGADIISGNMVPIALDNDAGLPRVTRRATFSQIVSGGSGVLAADPNSPFVFNNTTTEQVFQGGLTVPGNITLSGDLKLTGTISGNTTGYFDELYISGSEGGWHQITTGWSGASAPPYGGTEPAFIDSDERLKDGIYPIGDPINKLSQLQGVNFTWNDKSPKATQGTSDVGVIAQSVEKIMPEAIKTNPDGYLSVYYYKLIPLLIETIKEQETRISDLEKRINNG